MRFFCSLCFLFLLLSCSKAPDGTCTTAGDCVGDQLCTLNRCVEKRKDNKPVDKGKKLGEPCTGNEQCNSKKCINDGTSSYCSSDCGNGCPSGYTCDSTSAGAACLKDKQQGVVAKCRFSEVSKMVLCGSQGKSNCKSYMSPECKQCVDKEVLCEKASKCNTFKSATCCIKDRERCYGVAPCHPEDFTNYSDCSKQCNKGDKACDSRCKDRMPSKCSAASDVLDKCLENTGCSLLSAKCCITEKISVFGAIGGILSLKE